ncbi:hypothetical protein [Devosia salina]|uniref:DUF1311 domain-containing protein n=1 Tax=Devosia salina TaxID=2860336 RepID=A0ABX8WGA7_9HYPH|nr:hypothetical protein [Devosia salina]QYO76026.1 hypothetical protein K1X15_15555 [Devosia salina]
MTTPARTLLGWSAWLLLTTYAAAETPQDLWQQIALLPAKAETAKCDAWDGITSHIEQAGAAAMLESQHAMSRVAPMAAVSDAQSAAIETLLDYDLQACAVDLEITVRSLVDTTNAELQSAMAYLSDRRIAALDQCGSEQAPGYEACYSRTMIEYQALARDEANHRLDALGEAFASWRDAAADCLRRREDAVMAFERAEVGGPFAAQGITMRAMSWSLVHLHAETARSLCVSIFDAAHALDVTP